MVDRDYLRLYVGVRNHVLYNMYPPAKMSFVDSAFNAFLACLGGEPEKAIEVPDGYYCKAQDLVNLFRLDEFVEQEMEYSCED